MVLIGLFAFRQPDMNQLNAVLVEGFYNQPHTIFQSDGFAFTGQAVQLLDNVAADGIIVFRFQFGSKGFVQVA